MQDVAVDACCLINLLAAGSILSPPSPSTSRRGKKAVSAGAGEPPHGLGLALHVPVKVTQEALYLLQPDEEDSNKLVKTPIDLAPCLQSDLIHPCDVEGEQETDLFVRLATRLDDGEAACLAIAQCRGWCLATDDRLATKLAVHAGVTVITPPEMVKRWAETSGAADATVAAAIQDIQAFARFVPRATSAECAWWMSILAKAVGSD